ncbi:Metal dependent phosphohydrolase [Carbonactinospora thermoautotrophica]|uniref:Metal dependent phosphohydrolase n=1 Tax=Carbonactinospora thermoautotrophica TaxID=1469144 RepID=A0A132MZJ7_9ACTN|nr:CRISPR-associated protein Cas5 [Carbonactinospora thermoautotrophica]KWX03254.1 Metal dependent phosphohydrolase [Carbonactinospora thermoautotrophica]
MSTVQALEVTVTAPVASFRNPLYAGVQVGLPCPPPATVGGLLAAAAGGWDAVDPGLRFAMAFHARGKGVDLETYHPLDATGKKADPTPREREFLADVTLTVWLVHDPDQRVVTDLDLWQRRLRRPVWPLRLGRSQDLVGVRTQLVELRPGPGRQGAAVLPAGVTGYGARLRLPTAVARDRSWTVWEDYRHHAAGTCEEQVPESTDWPEQTWVDKEGRAVVLLPPTHPIHAEERQP